MSLVNIAFFQVERFATNESANPHPESWFIEKLKICTETKAR